MMGAIKVCLIGQVLVDVTFLGSGREPKLRLGGIAHAARALWAMDTSFVLAYFAPEYLDANIYLFAESHGNASVHKVGNVLGSPNVVTIGEPTEAGPQGYQFLLRDEHRTIINHKALAQVCLDREITDYIIFPGGFDVSSVLTAVGQTTADIHIDANYQPDDPSEFSALGRSFSTIMLSTSSEVFKSRYRGSVSNLCDTLLGGFADAVLFKENRGGTRYFPAHSRQSVIRTSSQTRPILHSVGVGDCFDAVYVVNRRSMEVKTALAYSSFIAAEYACTTHPDDFRDATRAAFQITKEDIVQLSGVSLSWEDRPQCHIYIAAPDFQHVERGPIEQLVSCLSYHNFSPRRPVLENGEMGLNAEPQRKQMLCDADVSLMDECRIMVAVLLYDDPGTLIEIGMAVQREMPVIVYDPYGHAENLMLTQLPHLVSSSLDEVISAVFKHASKGKSQ